VCPGVIQLTLAFQGLGEIMKETRIYSTVNSFTTFWPRTIYCGTLTYADLVIEDYCEPIVDKEIWDAVQKIQE
jgi:hypothetical protein